ncbi:MAG: hypothetical protein ACPGLV_05785 [Bacteroidia bacterium]
MKKTFIYSLAVLFLAGLVVLQSCTGTETTDPVVVVTSSTDGWDGNSNTYSGDVGDTLTLDITVTADGIFNTLRITQADATGNLLEKTREEDGQTTYETSYDFVLDEANAGDTVTLTIAGIDEEANSSEETVTVIVAEKSISVVKYTAKLMYVPLAGSTNTETFFSTDDGDTYSRDDVENTADAVSPRVDFGYYYGATNMASMASPAAYPELFQDLSAWGTKNETLMKISEMDESHFEMIETNADLEMHYGMTDMADADGDVINLEVGNLVAFELDAAKGAKHGFFKVKSIVGTFNSGDYIEIDVVIVGEE